MYQATETRAEAWRELCGELTLIRKALPARIWFRFDPEDQRHGTEEAIAAIDLLLAELLSGFNFKRTEAVLPWLYGKVRNIGRSKAQENATEFQEELLPVDDSREIEAPDGASKELEQLWSGTLDPFDFLEKHRGQKIKEIDYQILVRFSQNKTSAEIGAELDLTAENVRYRLAAVLKKIRG